MQRKDKDGNIYEYCMGFVFTKEDLALEKLVKKKSAKMFETYGRGHFQPMIDLSKYIQNRPEDLLAAELARKQRATLKPPKKKRGRPSKKALAEAQAASEAAQAAPTESATASTQAADESALTCNTNQPNE
jgi:hypothetical protein